MAKKKQELLRIEPKSRAKYQCPTNLTTLIELANKFHPKGLLDIQDYAERAEQRISKEEYRKLTQAECFKLDVQEIMTDLGEKSGGFVLSLFRMALKHVRENYPEDNDDDALSPNMVLAFIGSYVNIKSDLDNLVKFAHALDKIRNGEIPMSSIESLRFSATLIPTISENGRIKMRMNTYFSDAVDGIPPDRIRICKNCERVFWAKREDSRSCSPRCLNILNVRDSRTLSAEEKAARKDKRRANKKHNQKLTNMRKEKNSLL